MLSPMECLFIRTTRTALGIGCTRRSAVPSFLSGIMQRIVSILLLLDPFPKRRPQSQRIRLHRRKVAGHPSLVLHPHRRNISPLGGNAFTARRSHGCLRLPLQFATVAMTLLVSPVTSAQLPVSNVTNRVNARESISKRRTNLRVVMEMAWNCSSGASACHSAFPLRRHLCGVQTRSTRLSCCQITKVPMCAFATSSK